MILARIGQEEGRLRRSCPALTSESSEQREYSSAFGRSQCSIRPSEILVDGKRRSKATAALAHPPLMKLNAFRSMMHVRCLIAPTTRLLSLV